MKRLPLALLLVGCAGTPAASSENSTAVPEQVSIPTPVQPPPMQLVLADLSGVVNGKWVNKTTAVGGAVQTDALVPLAEGGVERLINLRGLNELSGEEATLAAEASLEFIHLPITGMADFTDEFLQEFDRLISEEIPTLVHCASGNRVGAAFALHAKAYRGATVEESLELGKRHGLTSLESAVRDRLQESP